MEQKMWGTPIWIFFHSLANDITDKQFNIYKDKILNIFQSVCSLLPCIVCRNHAQEAINKAYIKFINSKHDFKIFLIQFHNLVNIRRKVLPLTEIEVDNIYKFKSFQNSVQNFINVFYLNIYSKDLSFGLKKQNFLKSNYNLIFELKKIIQH